MHTILGAGGPVSNELTRILLEKNIPVRLISRKKVTVGNAEWTKADLLNKQETIDAAKGSEVIYLCAGLKYDIGVWQSQWPVIIENVIEAAKLSGARLIFFDNVYMYGLVIGPMKEETPYNPSSEKGKVRAGIASRIIEEANSGNLRASIARAADFYGAESLNSFYDSMILDKYAKNQTAMWMGDPEKLHTFTYVPDAAYGMYLLGQHPESDNQVWHLPSAPPLTGKQFIQLAAEAYNIKPKYFSINKFMLWLTGLFNPLVKGTVEMYYQYDHDYIFDSSKFEKAFDVKPTTYKEGIKHLSETIFKKA